MRPSADQAGGYSTTPIYDSLCAEYRRLFRALPGDRSGEERLGFEGFGSLGGLREAGETGRGSGWGPWQRHQPTALPALPPGRRDQGPQGL